MSIQNTIRMILGAVVLRGLAKALSDRESKQAMLPGPPGRRGEQPELPQLKIPTGRRVMEQLAPPHAHPATPHVATSPVAARPFLAPPQAQPAAGAERPVRPATPTVLPKTETKIDQLITVLQKNFGKDRQAAPRSQADRPAEQASYDSAVTPRGPLRAFFEFFSRKKQPDQPGQEQQPQAQPQGGVFRSIREIVSGQRGGGGRPGQENQAQPEGGLLRSIKEIVGGQQGGARPPITPPPTTPGRLPTPGSPMTERLARSRRSGGAIRGMLGAARGGGAARGAAAAGGRAAGMGGMAAAGAGGAAAGAGLALAGVAAAGLAVGVALAALPKMFRKLGDSLLRSQEHLQEFSGGIAHAFQVLEAERVQRNVRLGAATQASTTRLAEGQSDLEEAMLPFQAGMTNIKNDVMGGINKLTASVVEGVGEVTGLRGWFEGKSDETKVPPWQEFLADIADGRTRIGDRDRKR